VIAVAKKPKLPSEESVREALKSILDPELGVNIVDLGLIYSVAVSKGKAGGAFVDLKMTLTTIGCPFAGYFASEVEKAVKAVENVEDAHIHVVWDPPWQPEMMSKAAKEKLGIF
jgi:metal-sulfur cluster biosynthetic enzyme